MVGCIVLELTSMLHVLCETVVIRAHFSSKQLSALVVGPIVLTADKNTHHIRQIDRYMYISISRFSPVFPILKNYPFHGYKLAHCCCHDVAAVAGFFRYFSLHCFVGLVLTFVKGLHEEELCVSNNNSRQAALRPSDVFKHVYSWRRTSG